MDKKRLIYNFILDFWKLVKEYTPVPDQLNQEEWDRLTGKVDELAKKYKDDSKEWKNLFEPIICVWLDYGGKYE